MFNLTALLMSICLSAVRSLLSGIYINTSVSGVHLNKSLLQGFAKVAFYEGMYLGDSMGLFLVPGAAHSGVWPPVPPPAWPLAELSAIRMNRWWDSNRRALNGARSAQ